MVFLTHRLKARIQCNDIFSKTANRKKYEINTVFSSLYIEIKLTRGCERVGMNLKVNKRLLSCIKQPRVDI